VLEKIPIAGQYGATAVADNASPLSADSPSAMSKVLTFAKNMNTNDYFAIISLFLLVTVACIGLAAWCGSPRIVSKGDDVLTHMMQEAGGPDSSGKRRKIKKKKKEAVDAHVSDAKAEKGKEKEKKKTKKRGDSAESRDLELGGAPFAAEAVQRRMSARAHGEVDLKLPHLASQPGPREQQPKGAPHYGVDGALGAIEDDAHSVTSSGSGSGSVASSSAYEENLKKSLLSLLRGGMTMTQFRPGKPPKSILLSLAGASGNTLRWRSPRLLARNSYSLALVAVVSIEWGKNTQVFLSCKEAEQVSNDVCFSLVSESMGGGQFSTLDLQASSKVERDLLVQGFTLLIGAFKQRTAQDQLQL